MRDTDIGHVDISEDVMDEITEEMNLANFDVPSGTIFDAGDGRDSDTPITHCTPKMASCHDRTIARPPPKTVTPMETTKKMQPSGRLPTKASRIPHVGTTTKDNPQEESAEAIVLQAIYDGRNLAEFDFLSLAESFKLENFRSQNWKVIHPDYFPVDKVTAMHATLVAAQALQDARRDADKIAVEIGKERDELRRLLSKTYEIFFTTTGRLVGFEAPCHESLLRGVDITTTVKKNPTMDNLAKLWFVMFGCFDHNKAYVDKWMETQVMEYLKYSYGPSWREKKLRKQRKEGAAVGKLLFRKNCVHVQIMRVRQNKIKNINKTLLITLGLKLCTSKPSVKGKQAKRRKPGQFEKCFVLMVDPDLWRAACRRTKVSPDEVLDTSNSGAIFTRKKVVGELQQPHISVGKVLATANSGHACKTTGTKTVQKQKAKETVAVNRKETAAGKKRKVSQAGCV